MNVAVVGAGAVGATLAAELAARDARVTLYERESVGAGASGRAAGLCYDAFADQVDAELASRSLERFRALRDGFTDRPYVWLARAGDDRGRRAIDETVPRMRANGLDVSSVSPAALAERFPRLRTDDVGRAAVAENAGYADPAAYTRAMADRAVESGVDLRTRTPVSLSQGRVVETPDGRREYDAVAVAAGARTARVLAGAGLPVPLKPYRVQALTTESGPAGVPMLYDATGGYYLRPHGTGLLVGDGTEPVERDPDDWAPEADDWFLADCADHLRTALGVDLGVERAWAGLCTATPDGNPLLGERAPGVYVAAGWQGHGFMRAPAAAERLAEQVLGGDGVDAFSPGRFEGSEAFEIVEGAERWSE